MKQFGLLVILSLRLHVKHFDLREFPSSLATRKKEQQKIPILTSQNFCQQHLERGLHFRRVLDPRQRLDDVRGQLT